MNHTNLVQKEGKPYRKLPIDCDLSWTSIAEAMRWIGRPADYWTITVGEFLYDTARYLMHNEWHTKSPFSPEIHLQLDLSLDRYEWYITAHRWSNDINPPSVGSPSV